MNKPLDIEKLLASDEARLFPRDNRLAISRNGDVYLKSKGLWIKRKIYTDPKNYQTIDAHGKTYRLHRVLYQTFIGLSDEKLLIRHLDGNPKNNSLSNLAEGTQKENMADCIRHGRTTRGEKNSANKFDEWKIRLCREMGAAGIVQRRIAKKLGMSCMAVSMVIRRTRWGWLE